MKITIILIFISCVIAVKGCDTTTCPVDQGVCSNETCECDPKWATETNSEIQCNYQRKEWLAALLLQIFLGGWGAANFYTLNIQYAVPQLILGIAGLLGPCVAGCLACCSQRRMMAGMIIIYVIVGLSALATSAWWIADLVRYATDAVPDGNGYKLYHI